MPYIKANFPLKNDPAIRGINEDRGVFERTLLQKGGLEGSITLFIRKKDASANMVTS